MGRPRALILAVGLLALVEFGIARADWVYRVFPFSSNGVVFFVEDNIIAKARDPQILIMGSSRARDAIMPRVLEAELGLPEGAVLNLGLSGGRTYDSYILQKRNHDRLKKARLLVYCIDDWQCNGSIPLGDRFQHFAGLHERLEATPGLAGLVGYWYRTFEKQKLCIGIFRQLLASGFTRRKIELDDWGRVRWRDEAVEGAATETMAERAAVFYRNYTPSPVLRGYLEKLLNAAKQDGQQVLVIQLPLRDEYVQEVRANHAADYEAYKRFMQPLHPHFFEEGSACGLQSSDFYDYGHLTDTGAEIFTRYFAQWLKDHS